MQRRRQRDRRRRRRGADARRRRRPQLRHRRRVLHADPHRRRPQHRARRPRDGAGRGDARHVRPRRQGATRACRRPARSPVGVPGSVAVLRARDRKRSASKTLAELLAPAADVAEQGFRDRRALRREAAGEPARDRRSFPKSARILLKPDGTPLRRRRRCCVQPDLAKTYRGIAEHGIDWFYRGAFAKPVGEWMAANGGIITEADFANYQMKLREPLDHDLPRLHDHRLPAAQLRRRARRADPEHPRAFRPRGRWRRSDPADRIHVIAEAMKLAFADRAHWLGDPDFVNVPRGARSIAKYVADSSPKKIDLHSAPPHATSTSRHSRRGAQRGRRSSKHTTHIAAADAEGNWVAHHDDGQHRVRLEGDRPRHRRDPEQPDGRFLDPARRAERVQAGRQRGQRRSRPASARSRA